MGRKNRILLVEDNEQILQGNARMFSLRGYSVHAALTLAEARAAFAQQTPDAVLLDIMLPDGSGFDFIRELRQVSDVPILLLTGLTTPENVVRGLQEGGDDYLTKPYNFSILLARVEALLRRAGHIPRRLTKGALEFDILANHAYIHGRDLILTKREFACLLLLAQNEGKSLSSAYIYKTVWQMSLADDTQAIRTIVSRLRNKLKGSGYTVTAQYGAGYCFQPEG